MLSDWDTSYYPYTEKPGFNEYDGEYYLGRVFGDPFENPNEPVEPILTAWEVLEAVKRLTAWRSKFGLEGFLMGKNRWYADRPERYTYIQSMCSANTQELGKLYYLNRSDNCCDDKAQILYPLLDRIPEWMDSFYGQ